jgi:hypothetical protein
MTVEIGPKTQVDACVTLMSDTSSLHTIESPETDIFRSKITYSKCDPTPRNESLGRMLVN